MRVYTGIGSRRTPAHILDVMSGAAYWLACDDWTLRSGCAAGADSAFEQGANEAAAYFGLELFLPWFGFEGRSEHDIGPNGRFEPQPEAFEIAERFHPNWANLKQGAKRLHARNVHQILGPDVTAPVLSRFVICWTPDGAGGGGTGQALRIAKHYDVPIFDVAIPDALARVERFLERS